MKRTNFVKIMSLFLVLVILCLNVFSINIFAVNEEEQTMNFSDSDTEFLVQSNEGIENSTDAIINYDSEYSL